MTVRLGRDAATWVRQAVGTAVALLSRLLSVATALNARCLFLLVAVGAPDLCSNRARTPLVVLP